MFDAYVDTDLCLCAVYMLAHDIFICQTCYVLKYMFDSYVNID
jgi:hypothetical protein